ncbi:hypothetical protein MK805_16275 [Shimazuella sp. AN120528]|uniref:hypothetical protein n=1 Tax=Shimazuella soli TaxID=1892854 RepID=UPI001F107EA5|nr:hypothetical protein [Shimazuella soli]MCH5586497.1 hypothetical protein [Shimazuella soli]
MNPFGILEAVSVEVDDGIHTFAGFHGPITIIIRTFQPELVEWTGRRVICRGGLVTLGYTPDEGDPDQISFEIDVKQEQVFQLVRGKSFFTITYKGNSIPFLTDPFQFFRDGKFIPARDRLKERVIVR